MRPVILGFWPDIFSMQAMDFVDQLNPKLDRVSGNFCGLSQLNSGFDTIFSILRILY